MHNRENLFVHKELHDVGENCWLRGFKLIHLEEITIYVKSTDTDNASRKTFASLHEFIQTKNVATVI